MAEGALKMTPNIDKIQMPKMSFTGSLGLMRAYLTQLGTCYVLLRFEIKS